MASKSSVFTVVVAGKSTLSKVTENEARSTGKSTSKIASNFNEMTSRIGHNLEKIAIKFEAMDVVGASALGGLGHQLDTFAVKSVTTKDIVKGAMKQAGMAILGVAAGVAAFALKSAEDYASANNALKAAVEGSGGSWAKVEGQIAKVEGKYHKFGKTSAQINSALAQSVISTGNVTESIKHLPIALDLAQAKHIDLNQAMLAVDKAASGNSRVLKQLGIDIAIPTSSALKLQQAQSKVTSAQKDLASIISNFPNAAEAGAKGHEKYMRAVEKVKTAEKKLADQHGASKAILKTLSDRVGGQASAAAETYAMKLEAARAKATDLARKLGDKLQPAISNVLAFFSKFVDYANKHTWVWKVLAGLLGTVVVGALISMMAPVGTLIGGLAGIFASAVSAAAGLFGVDLGAMAAAGGLIALRGALMATGIGAIILLIIAALVWMIFHWRLVWHWVKIIWNWMYDHIKTVATNIWNFIDKWLIQPLMTVWNTLKKPISEAFSWIGNAITAPFKLAMDAITWLWNHTIGGFSFHLPSWLGGYGITVPKIGGGGGGGASGPSGAAISTATVGKVTPGIGAVGAGGVIGAPGGNQAHVVINVHGGDPNQVVAALVAHTRKNGPIPARTSLPSSPAFT